MPFSPGFNLSEALDLVTLCAIIEGQTVLPAPAGWIKLFESPQISYFTEKWQLWQNASGPYAIVIRGTVPTDGSILEDLISFLAQATGSVTMGSHYSPLIRMRAYMSVLCSGAPAAERSGQWYSRSADYQGACRKPNLYHRP